MVEYLVFCINITNMLSRLNSKNEMPSFGQNLVALSSFSRINCSGTPLHITWCNNVCVFHEASAQVIVQNMVTIILT